MANMVSEWTIRRYRPTDTNAVWRVHDRSLRHSAMKYSPEYNRYLRHIKTAFLDRGGEFLVVVADSTAPSDPEGDELNDVVAIGGFQPLVASNDPDATIRKTLNQDDSTAHVRSVAVLPSVQSCGVGTALMDDLERRAVDRGFSQVVLSTTTELVRSQRFYEARGYEPVPIGDAHERHRWYLKSPLSESGD